MKFQLTPARIEPVTFRFAAQRVIVGTGKVVSLTHRPPLPPGNTPGTHFC